jgi:hypothetical protein
MMPRQQLASNEKTVFSLGERALNAGDLPREFAARIRSHGGASLRNFVATFRAGDCANRVLPRHLAQ